jgi:hypothetical protein
LLVKFLQGLGQGPGLFRPGLQLVKGQALCRLPAHAGKTGQMFSKP